MIKKNNSNSCFSFLFSLLTSRNTSQVYILILVFPKNRSKHQVIILVEIRYIKLAHKTTRIDGKYKVTTLHAIRYVKGKQNFKTTTVENLK